MNRFLLLVTILLSAGSLVSAQSIAVQSGNWGDGATWGGGVPTGDEVDISIPTGIAVTLDLDVECGTIMVEGQLNVAEVDLSLTCDSLIVMGPAAVFEVGTPGDRFTNRFLLTLKGDTSEDFQPAGHSSMGARALLAIMGGTVSIHGEDRVEWTQLGASVAAGESAIVLKEAVDWRVGDEILICSSRLNWDEAEQMIVSSVSPDGLTVGLSSELAYPHCGEVKTYTRPEDGKEWTADLRAEVGLLTRNITIQGAADADDMLSPNYEFGAHIMVHGEMEHGGMTMPTGVGNLQGVEIFRCGQLGLLGRYPFHWHLCLGDAAGQYFKDNAVHRSFNRAITIHGTDYVTVENNFCYDHVGHGVFLEDGGERFNTIRNNVVLLTKRPRPGEEVTPSDNEANEAQNRTPASFWITNPNNTFVDNVAAGTHGTGYWFIFPDRPLAPSGNIGYFSGQRPFRQPLGAFSGNKAHSCMNGFDIFDRLNSDHSIRRNAGWDNATLHVMENCTWYSNQTAVYAGTGQGNPTDNVIYRNNVFVDNSICLMLATYNIVEESVFVADSGLNLIGGERRLYRVYDGAGQVRDSHFIGWNAQNANFLMLTGAATRHVNHRFSTITTDHAGLVRASLANFDFTPQADIPTGDPAHPRVWSIALRNEDGSLTGKPNTTIVSNHPFMLVGDEFQPPNWTSVLRSDHKFVLGIDDPANNPKPNVSVVRSKPGTPEEGVYYIDGYNEHHQLPLIANEDFLYTYHYETLPSSRRIDYKLDDASPGDTVLLRYKDFGNLSGISVSGHGAVSRGSLAALNSSASTAYFIEPNGDLFLRPVATGKFQSMRIQWSSNTAMPSVDLDGDGITDGGEAARGRNPFHALDFGAEFNTDADFENWDFSLQVSGSNVGGGVLSGTSNGDSQFWNQGLSIDADDFELVLVRLKADVTTPVDLFWQREDSQTFAGHLQRVNYSVPGQWETLVFPVGGNAEWQGTITAMRIDPMAGPGNFEIDWIRVLSNDNDEDKDGLFDSDEGFGDPDGDGLTNLRDPDSDGDFTPDGVESGEGRNPYDGSDLAFHFETEGDFEGWTNIGRIIGQQVTGGSLQGTTETNDPILHHPAFHLPAGDAQEILVRMRASAAGRMDFFWGTSVENSFSGTRRVSTNYDNAGEWELMRLPVADHLAWTGTITRMRIDPVSVANADFEIDWVRGSERPQTLSLVENRSETAAMLMAGRPLLYRIPLSGLSRVTISTSGSANLLGEIYGPNGGLVSNSQGSPRNGEFQFDRILDASGDLTLFLEGITAGASGEFDLTVTVSPLPESRPDAAVGKTLTRLRGDGRYGSSLAGQKIRQISKKGRRVKAWFQIQNDGGLEDSLQIRGTSPDRSFRARYIKVSGQTGNVTAAIKRGSYVSRIQPLSFESLQLKISPRANARRKRKVFAISASSVGLVDRSGVKVRIKR